MDAIAEIAGVSKATVSRSIRAPHLVKDATRRRIEQIIAEKNYIYNISAAEFSSNMTTLVGLMITSVKSSIFADFIDGIESQIRGARHSLLIGYTNFDLEEESQLVSTFMQRNVCGLIVVGIDEHNQHLYTPAIKKGIEVVNTWEYAPDASVDCVGIDNEKAAYDATRYLVSLGHRRIAIIMGPYSISRRVRRRYEGFHRALREAEIKIDPGYILERHPTFIEGQEAMNRLLDLAHPPTALFAASDTLAIGAMKAIRDRGLSVPRDISIAGFDNVDIASFVSPALTTIRVPAFEMGRLAAKVVLEGSGRSGPAASRKYCLDSELIIRDSCSPLRGTPASSEASPENEQGVE